MLRKITIALAAVSLLGIAAIPTDALAFGRGGGGGHFGGGGFSHGFGGGGFSHGFAGRGFVGHGFGPGFRGHGFGPGVGLGIGLGLGYGGYYYGNRCYAWTPYGYRWACGYPYPYY